MPEDKKKKHTNKGSAGVRKSHNPLSNAMTNRRKGEPAGSGTRKGKATRGGHRSRSFEERDKVKLLRKEKNLSDKINTFFKSGGGSLPDAPELLDRLGAKGIDIEKRKKDYPEVY